MPWKTVSTFSLGLQSHVMPNLNAGTVRSSRNLNVDTLRGATAEHDQNGDDTDAPPHSAAMAVALPASLCSASAFAASISAALASTSFTIWSIISASWIWWSVTPER